MSFSIPKTGPSIAKVVADFMHEMKGGVPLTLSCRIDFFYHAHQAVLAAGGGVLQDPYHLIHFETNFLVKASVHKNLKEALLKKVSGVFQKLATLTDAIQAEIELGLIFKTSSEKTEAIGQKLSLSYKSFAQVMHSLYEASEFEHDVRHLEEAEALALRVPPGLKFQEMRLLHTNVMTDFSHESEIADLFCFLLKDFLTKKGDALTIAEYLLAHKIANDASWKGSESGLCAGICHAFNGFMLSRILSGEHLAPLLVLLDEFLASSFYQKAALTQLLEFKSMGLYACEHGSLVQKAPSFLSKRALWPRLQHHLEDLFPMLQVVSRQQEQKWSLHLQLDHVNHEIDGFAKSCGLEAEAKTPSAQVSAKVAAAVAGSIALNPVKIMQAMHMQKKLLAALDDTDKQTCEQSLNYLKQLLSVHDSFACKIGYFYPDRSGGHAVSLVVSSSRNAFFFYDSNSSLIAFHSAEDLTAYAQKHLSEYVDFELIFMLPKV